MLKKLFVSIISPAHNEETTVVSFVENAVNSLRKNSLSGEVIIIENGSTDKTKDLLKQLQEKIGKVLVVKSLPKGNKGLALKEGFEAAKGENVVTLDMDLWDEDFVKQSVENLMKYDIVVGSKVISGSKDERVLASRLLNFGYNLLFRLVFNLLGTETHAKLSFKLDKILPLVRKCKTEDLNFDTELIIRAERAGLSKLEIPTAVKETRPRRFSVPAQLIKTMKNFTILLKSLGPSPNWNYVLVGTGLLIGSLLRFLHYKSWFFFSVDEEHYSFMTHMITVDHHLPLIGGPISGTKLYMAPWFLYFNSILFFISNNNPLFSGIIFTTIELGTILLIYLIGKKLFSSKAGAIAALLYGSSFFMALFDRHYWNITLTPVISAATFYCLLRYLEGNRRWLIFAALIVGFGISSTFSLFAVLIFAVIVIALFKRPILKIDLLWFLSIIAILHVPLILFDLRHNFWLLDGLVEFLTVHSFDKVPFLTRVTTTLTIFFQTLGKVLVTTSPIDVADEISICADRVARLKPVWWAVALATASVVGYLAVAFRSKNKNVWLLGLMLLVNICSLFLFRADPSDRHFLPFLPLYFITVGVTLSLIINRVGKLGKITVGVLLGFLIAMNLISFSFSYASYGIADKENAVQTAISQTRPGRFSFDAIGDCHKWGYRYLFAQFGHEPSQSYLDSSFSWMYTAPVDPAATEKTITFFAPNKHASLTQEEEKQKQNLIETSQKIIISDPITIFIGK